MMDKNKLIFNRKPGATPIFLDHHDGDVHHTFVIGTTGRGSSRFLEAEAARRGISYDELLKSMEPTPEQKEADRIRQEQRRQKKAARLDAVREAYWASTDEAEFDYLHDALTIAEIVKEPVSAQVKALFMMLPEEIIGQGIAWGFTDTEVRESIHRFVADNREAVISRVTAV